MAYSVIDISNCCGECINAFFYYEIIDKEQGESSTTYTITYYVECDDQQSDPVTTTFTLSCGEPECIQLQIESIFCTFEVSFGNTPDCTCDPCPVECGCCGIFATEGPIDGADLNGCNGSTCTNFIDHPSSLCKSQTYTFNFQVDNPALLGCSAPVTAGGQWPLTSNVTVVSTSPVADSTSNGATWGADWGPIDDFGTGVFNFSITFTIVNLPDPCSGSLDLTIQGCNDSGWVCQYALADLGDC
jgi:hypothetical protein